MRYILAPLLLLRLVVADYSNAPAPGTVTVDEWKTMTMTEDHWNTMTMEEWSTKTDDHWYTTSNWYTKSETSTTTTTTTTTTTKPTTTTTTTTTTKPTTTTATTTNTTTTTKPTTTTTTSITTDYKTNTTTTTTTTTKPTTTTTTSITTNYKTNSTTTSTTTTTTITKLSATTTTTTLPTTTTTTKPTTSTSTTTIFITVPTISTCPLLTTTVPVPTTVTSTVTSTTTSIVVQPGTGTTSVVTQPGTGTTVTQPGTGTTVTQPGTDTTVTQPGTATTVTQPGTAVTITSIRSITSIQAPVTSTVTASSSSCDFCKIELYGTELAYPTLIITTTYYLTTVSIIPTQYSNGSRTTNTLTTVSTPNSCLLTPAPSVWTFSGIALTSPTHYVYFSRGEHDFLYPSPGVYGGCGLSTTPLTFPASTNVPAFLAAIGSTNITTTETTLPTKIVAYLDSLPTINAQLNGSLVRSCDDPSGMTTPFAGYTAFGTSGVLNPTGTTTVISPDQSPPPGN